MELHELTQDAYVVMLGHSLTGFYLFSLGVFLRVDVS